MDFFNPGDVAGGRQMRADAATRGGAGRRRVCSGGENRYGNEERHAHG
ncbi:MAG: hypothetical protein K2X41_01125 [Hyphomicrobium sp.]|nr:hypothetical protein [Hyphomicrobium sp.]